MKLALSRHIPRLMAVGVAFVSVVQSDVAHAQAAKGKKPKSLSPEVEEITVTAQRREESIQETPVSVTAVTTETIVEQGIENIIDMAPLTPNLHIHANMGGNSGQTINMRGAITTDPLITLEPTVGVYVDGVYIAKSAGSRFDMRDVERIEVLRGPQGTLYGRNTVGGAISIITKKPQGDKSVSAFTSMGNYDNFRSSITGDMPLVGEDGLIRDTALGTVNVRSTFEWRQRDGFFRNTGTGTADFDNLNRLAVNQAVRWVPAEPLTIDYNFDYTRARERPNAFQLSGVRSWSPAKQLLDPYVQVHRSKTTANNMLILPLGGTQEPVNHFDVRGNALTATYDLGEVGPLGAVTLKSISAYRSLGTAENQDLDGAPVSVADFGLNINHKEFSQELQWSGAMERWNYVAGFYYFWEQGGEDNDQVILGSTPYATMLQSGNKFTNFSYAPFGQATYTPPILEDRLSLTAGLRYTREKKHGTRSFNCIQAFYFPPGAAPVPVCSQAVSALEGDFVVTGAEAKKNFEEVTPMGSVAYQWTDDLMTFVKVSRGFKSGGFNGRSTTPASFLNSFEPEKLTAYEGGIKSDWLDKRLRVNVSGFFSDYKDLQVAVFRADPRGGTVSSLQNAAEAEIKGLELEVQAAPIRGVDLRLGYGWLDPEYQEFIEEVETSPGSGQYNKIDVKGDRHFVLTPEHTVSGGVTYSFEPTDWGTLSATVDAYWQDAVVFLVKDNDLDAQGSYGLLNARVQLVDIPTETYGMFDLAAYGRNLTDRKYRSFGIDFGQLGYAGNSYGNPRTIGVEVAWRWNAS